MDLAKYVGNRIKQLRESKNMTQDELASKLDTTRQSISRYETGERKANQDVLFELSEIFSVTLDDFFPPRDFSSSPYYKLTEKEKFDIGKEVDKLIDGMYTDAEVNFYGEPMDEESKDSLRMAIQMAMELNKEKAKKKFTPKKYRDE